MAMNLTLEKKQMLKTLVGYPLRGILIWYQHRARFADEEKDDSNKTQEIEEELFNQMKSINEKIQKLSGRANTLVDQLKSNNIMQTVYKK